MSRAMGSSWAVTCWGAASWLGACAMLVLRGRVAAGAGWCVGARGSARFGMAVLWPVVGVERSRGVWGFQGRCPGWGGRGADLVRCRSCVGGLWCSVSLGEGGECGVAWWRWVAWWPSQWGGGGASCQGLVGWVVARASSSGGVRQSHAVPRSSLWRFPVRGPRGIVVVTGLGSPGAGCVGFECPNPGGVIVWCLGPEMRGVLSMGHARAATFVGSASQRVASSWACCGPGAAPVAGQRLCSVSMARKGLWASAWGGSVVGHRLVAGARTSLWVGLSRCLLGVSGGCRWSAGCGGFLVCNASMGVPLCAGGPQWGLCPCCLCGLLRCGVCRPRRLLLALCCGGA